MEWKYLETEPFQLRYVLAAHFVRHCVHIVEIGGYKTPITNFLTGEHLSVTVYDPLVEPVAVNHHKFGKVLHIKDFFQAYPLPESGFGLVMLGLEMKGELQLLLEWIRKSQVAVIEFPIDFTPSVNLFSAIVRETRPVKLQVGLDLSNNDLGNMQDSFPPRCQRRLYVL